MNKRKLVTVRSIGGIEPIDGADNIEIVLVDGWKVITKKGEFAQGELCFYCEIDSFLPDGVPAWQFLVDKSSRIFNGKKGHKLRTVKLKGQISQGFALPLSVISASFPAVLKNMGDYFAIDVEGTSILLGRPGINNVGANDLDFSDALGIEKYEAPLAAELAGQALGQFPSFMQKTDQERCQNLKGEIFGYEDVIVPFSVDGMTTEAVNALVEKGIIRHVHGQAGPEYVKTLKAKASRDDRYEVSMKLDGSSMTAYVKHGDPQDAENLGAITGVCSRNLELKVNEENASNTFVKMFIEGRLQYALLQYMLQENEAIAVQGELMGTSIQGNRENFKDFRFYLFDIFLIGNSRYASPEERTAIFEKLLALGADSTKIFHVPVLRTNTTLEEIGTTSIEDLLRMAEGPSINHAIREGLVFKRMDGKFSFKAISNLFLAKEKD